MTLTYKLGGGTRPGVAATSSSQRVVARTADTNFSVVRPGEYYGIAIVSGNPTPWDEGMLDVELLKQAGRVSVRGNESTAAEIRLVTR